MAAAVLAGGVIVVPASAEPLVEGRAEPPSAGTVPPGRSGDEWITLVTGDRILVRTAPTGDRVVSARPGPGRAGMSFRHRTEHGDLFVLPSDAEQPVAAGTVDDRLFNVSQLVDLGFADRSRPDVPLLVTRAPGARTAVRGLLAAGDARLTRELPSVQAEAVAAGKERTGELWRSLRGGPDRPRLAAGVGRIALDGPVRATLDTSVPQIGAPEAWRAGHTGRGTTVAVLDTGIDSSHPDLAGAVVKAQDFTGGGTGAADRNGHGTHVAGIITGSGAASAGRYVGVAPDALLFNGRVLNDEGGGSESGILAGMEWAVAEGADVVNMSLGSFFAGDGTNLLDQAVNRLSAGTDTLFVVSAGNSGPRKWSIGSPGAADAALTVGAVNRRDELAEFSSRGPRRGVHAVKPDITAPGVDIVAARLPGARIGWPVGDSYIRVSGTSMAAPHVAGAAAILAGQRPDLGGEELKAVLMGTASPGAGLTVYEQGTGRVDLARATDQPLYTEPATIDNGFVGWPHHDDTPIGKTVTYRNATDVPVTLDLTVDVRDSSGRAAPVGMFTLDRARITVPARGSATAELVTDTRVPPPAGGYGGYGGILLASGPAGHRVRTPVGLALEAEIHTVSVTAHGHEGAEYSYVSARLVSLDDPDGVYEIAGLPTTARVPRGRYFLDGTIHSSNPNPGCDRQTALIEPTVLVESDLALAFDARDGLPFGAVVDRPTARPFMATVEFSRQVDRPGGPAGGGYLGDCTRNLLVRPSTTSAPEEQFTFQTEQRLAEPDGAGEFRNSPYLYHTRQRQDGRIAADLLVRRITDAEYAVVHTQLAGTGDQTAMSREHYLVKYRLPAKITEYYTPNVPWHIEMLRMWSFDDHSSKGTLSTANPETFLLRRPVARRWNVGVFGYAIPAGTSSAIRRGDEIVLRMQPFADQGTNHVGSQFIDAASTVLRRNGVQINDGYGDGWNGLQVPPEAATYRLEMVIDHLPPPALSRRTSTAWTFRSEHVTTATPLPLMLVRFAPALDEQNRAPAGAFTFPVYVQQQTGAEYGRLTGITVSVSYNGGGTWLPVTLTGSGLNRLASVTHPSGGGYVSLRASASDSAGNRVEQTIINAYRR